MTGEEFRARRRALGMSQRQLANKMGYCIGMIQAYEHERRRVTATAESILAIVEANEADEQQRQRRRIA